MDGKGQRRAIPFCSGTCVAQGGLRETSPVDHCAIEKRTLQMKIKRSGSKRSGFDFTRRALLKLTAATSGALAAGRWLSAAAQGANSAPTPLNAVLRVNGSEHRLMLDPRTTLLDALREHLKLTGTKKGCDHGQCGACTVLVDGRRINSCLSLAIMHEDDEIVTIEGLGEPGDLHPVQAAFVECDGFQCGYCTPGQICSAVGMLTEVAAGWPSHVTADVSSRQITLSGEEIRERMSGNICRCAAYPN